MSLNSHHEQAQTERSINDVLEDLWNDNVTPEKAMEEIEVIRKRVHNWVERLYSSFR